VTITPYAFQEADIRDLLAHNATGAIVAETGAGKTVIGAETARRSGLPTKLIVALQGTHKKVWKRTLLELDPEARIQRIDGTELGKKAMDALEWKEPGYYLMTPQLFTRWKPLHLRPDLMMVDEAHMLGNRNKPGGQTFMQMGAKSTGHRMVLSGTLYRNNFENAWTMARFLHPERSASGDIADIAPNRWIDNFCRTEYAHFAPGQRVVVGELEPGRFAALMPCWRQHFKREPCCEFHPEGFLHDVAEPIVIRETVELTAGQKKATKQMQRDYLAYLDLATKEWQTLPIEERKRKALVVKMPVTRQLRLSQITLAMPSIIPRPWSPKKAGPTSTDWDVQPGYVIAEDGLTKQAVDDKGFPLWDVVFAPDAESPKLDALMRILTKVGEPVVAATNSQKFAELAVNRLNASGWRAFEWSGSSTQTQRDQALDDFKAGKYDIIVGQTDAIGTGIDGLQDVAGVLVSLNKSRDIANETQLEGRLDRRGQKERGVIHYEIIAEGSTDEDVIDEQLQRRLELNRSLRKEIAKGVAQ